MTMSNIDWRITDAKLLATSLWAEMDERVCNGEVTNAVWNQMVRDALDQTASVQRWIDEHPEASKETANAD